MWLQVFGFVRACEIDQKESSMAGCADRLLHLRDRDETTVASNARGAETNHTTRAAQPGRGQNADIKYREQLQHAYQFLEQSLGSVLAFGELMNKPGAAPLRDLMKDARAAQLLDVRNAQEALQMVTCFCSEAGVAPQPAPQSAPQSPP